MIQYKLNCCGKIYSSRTHVNASVCPICQAPNPIMEEVDKEDQGLDMGGFSGDKKHEDREWGSFDILLDEEGIKVKKIVVKSGQRLSLQLHTKREEKWFIVEGFGTVQVGSDEFDLEAGDSITIRKYEAHRVRNSGLIDLVIVEIQTGDCQEDDIIRLQDDYGRE